MRNNIKMLCAIGASLMALSAAPAFAEGTAAGVVVPNTATLNYQSGGVAQGEVTSNIANFTVDRKINLLVTEIGNSATVVSGAGATNQVTSFTVRNSSNAPLDLNLLAANLATGTNAPFANGANTTDSFNVGTDAAGFRYAIDANANGLWDQATEPLITYLDEIAADAQRAILVIANVPAGVSNGGISVISLTATAHEAGTAGTFGAIVTANTGVNRIDQVDTVFADLAGSDDAAADGKSSARDQYNIVSANLTLSKLVRVISDGFSATNPKAIPGALLEYCLIVTNSGSAPATNVVLRDVVPTQTTYQAGTGYANGQTATPADGGNATCDVTPANGGSVTGVTYTSGTRTFETPALTVPANSSRTARFSVVVN